jgi:hypothetical protein
MAVKSFIVQVPSLAQQKLDLGNYLQNFLQSSRGQAYEGVPCLQKYIPKPVACTLNIF